MQDTLTILAQHHGEGQEFMQKMKDTAPNRFDDKFWAQWHEWIAPVLSDSPQIADFGCGPAMLLKSLHERYPTACLKGVECAPWMLVTLDDSCYEVIAHDLQAPNLPIKKNSLDAITAIFVVHEMIQPIQLLQSIYTCLKPGGRCLIIDWVRISLETYMTSESSDDIFDSNKHDTLSKLFSHFMEHNRYSRDDITWMLQQSGFTILENLQEERIGRWVVEK